MSDVAVDSKVIPSPPASSISSPVSSGTTASYSLAPDYSDDDDDDDDDLKIKAALRRLRDGQLHCERTLYFVLEKMDTIMREICILRADSHYLRRCASRSCSSKKRKKGACSRSNRKERYRQACSDMVQFGYAEKSGECASVEGDGEGVETLKMAAIATPSAEEVRQQRIARYKEERRRQLAAQFGRRDANAVTATQDAASIRTTRTSRLRSAASLTTDINGTARNGVRKDAGLKNSPTLLSSSSESKERSGTSPGMTNSSPRRERDKSAKRKSNLNRQLHSEQVIHSDSALPDDGVRRRSSQTRPASSGSNSSSVGVPSKAAGRPWSALPTPTTASRQHSAASLDFAASSKRLTPPRKSGGGSDRGSTPDRDSDAKRLTPPRKSGGGSDRGSTPDRDSDVSAPRGGRSSITRIPKKISTGSVGGSSSRESSPRHKSSCTKLSVSSQPSVDIGSPAAASTPASRVVVNGGVTHKDTTKSSRDTTNPAVGNHCAEVVSPAPQPPSTPPIAPSSHQQPSRWSWHTTTPVSILKRKTSQEEAPNQQSVSTAAGAVPPPVTFSPSVVDPPPSRRQGILKKHRSLDEAEVMRRRSSSPADVSEVATDFRPILKNQRRSSLEELRHRTQSPEPQSILKRKTSREESVENSSSEPHSILKRKSSSVDSEGSSSHITIAESVILSITGGVPPPSDDHVKPILKKKSFSGEDPPPEAGNASDVPRPILKKKPSVDVEDFEERHPMKPILKLRRDSMSVEEVSEVEVSSVSLSPILKRTEESSSVNTPEPRLRSVKKTEELNTPELRLRSVKKTEDFNTPETRLRSVKKTEDFNTPEPRLRSVFWRNCEKSSTDLTGSASNTCFSKRRSLDISSVREEDRVVHRPCRPGSVAERIMNMESFLAAEGCQDLPPKSPTVTSSVGALPKRRDRDRFLTQPITAQEISDSKNWIPDSPQPTRPEEVDEERIIAASTSSTSASNNDCAQQLKSSDLLSDVCVKSSDLSSAVPHNMADGECETVSSAVTQANMADDDSEAAACNGGLVRSKSVSARASMFEAQMKQAVEENKPRRFNKGSINRRSNQEGFARFATQPVTFDEVEEARRQNKDAQDSP